MFGKKGLTFAEMCVTLLSKGGLSGDR